MSRNLIVFDFDWSFADQDSDRYVFEVLSPQLRQLMEQRLINNNEQFTDLVADMLRKLNAAGKTRADIEYALSTLPVHPAMPRGVQNLKKKGNTTVLCLSNANSVYIPQVIKSHGVPDIFDELITNPATWDGDLLVLRRRVDPTGQQHGCKIGCSANMCKGDELEAFIQRQGGWDNFAKVVYVGDGNNDFCPVLRLREQDHVLARAGRELPNTIRTRGVTNKVHAQVHEWEGAWQVELFLDTLN